MYCTHCAKHVDEEKLEASKSSFAMAEEVKEGAKVVYVCPRCGHLIHSDIDEEETKSLARAAHAQIQRARNFLSSGLGFAAIGVILFIIAGLFFFLACKPSNQYQLTTTCAEFYVFVVLGSISVILLAMGIVYVVLGIIRKKQNEALLWEINNQTFVQ